MELKDHRSFGEAALLHGLLIKSDNYLHVCLEEASSYQMPYTIVSHYISLLLPKGSKSSWKDFELAMLEDYRKISNLTSENIG